MIVSLSLLSKKEGGNVVKSLVAACRVGVEGPSRLSKTFYFKLHGPLQVYIH